MPRTIRDQMILTEALNSVALEHAPDCECLACKAADGDPDALAEVYAAIAEQTGVPEKYYADGPTSAEALRKQGLGHDDH